MQASDVVITSTMDTSSGLRVNMYVQGTRGVIPQQDIISALQVMVEVLCLRLCGCELFFSRLILVYSPVLG